MRLLGVRRAAPARSGAVRKPAGRPPERLGRRPGRSTIKIVPKATSVTPGSSASTARKSTSPERKAAKVVESAEAEARRVRTAASADAARIRAEAEEHARRLVLDARASADGVRAEALELVSNLRQMSDSLRANAERLLEDIQSIHARMVRDLERVDPGAECGSTSLAAEADPSADARAAEPVAPAQSGSGDELDVPDFIQRR